MDHEYGRVDGGFSFRRFVLNAYPWFQHGHAYANGIGGGVQAYGSAAGHFSPNANFRGLSVVLILCL